MNSGKIKILALAVMTASLLSSCTVSDSPHAATQVKRIVAPVSVGNSQYVTEIPKERNSKNDLILVSWNAGNFGRSKSDETITFMAQLLRNADIVAIQEVSTKEAGAQAMARLNDELNRTGNKWDYLLSDPTHESKKKERYAFLWKTSRVEARPRRATLFDKLKTDLVREPAQVNFVIANKVITVTSFHLAPTDKRPEDEIQSLKRHAADFSAGNFIFVGDFNLSHDVLDTVFENELGCQHHIESKSSLKQKLDENGSYYSKEYDNIFTKGKIAVQQAAIVDFVPKFGDLSEARKISDHLPVFILFELR